MKKLILFFTMLWLGYSYTAQAQNANDYFQTTVTFPADFKVGTISNLRQPSRLP